jgi:hypothetical protein
MDLKVQSVIMPEGQHGAIGHILDVRHLAIHLISVVLDGYLRLKMQIFILENFPGENQVEIFLAE